MSTIKPLHRADIQSLRAFAILLVVASHAQVTGIQGGFVGVDVFFVLSGYLISGLILSELDTTGRFSAWRFYANRFKRLLPGLLIMLVATSGVAYLFSNPWNQIRDAVTAQAATLWLSNFYFATRSIGYFSSGLDTYLHLHTWSLAVEEQFYLIWPWVIMYLLAVWRWQGSLFNRKRLLIGLALISLLSLGLSAYQAQTSPEDGFYLMPSRAWEFALGTFVFIGRKACDDGRAAWGDALRGHSILNSAGLFFILIASIGYSDSLRYPGLWALLPSVGSALILLDAPERHGTSRISRLLLQQRGILFLGNISYSLYLWHWPVLKLGSEILGTDPAVRAGLILFSLLLATVAYKWVENPLHRLSVSHPGKIWLSSLTGIAGGLFCFVTWQTAADNLTQTPAQKKILHARWDVPEIYFGKKCDTWFHSSDLSVCTFGMEDATKTLVLFGDSVGAQWFQAIKKEYVETRGWKLAVLTKSSCPVEEVSFYYARIKSTYTVCDEWRKKAIDYIEEIQPALVIMGSSHYGFSPKQLSDGIRATLNRISPGSGAVAIIVPAPRLDFDGVACLSSKAHWPTWLPREDTCGTPLNRGVQAELKNNIREGANRFSNVMVIDFDDLVCPGGICRAMIDDKVVFRDSLHLTNRFVESISTQFSQAISLVSTGKH